MPKYRVTTTIDAYWDVIIEAEDAAEARDRANIEFDHSRDLLRPYIKIYPVSDETELGDVG